MVSLADGARLSIGVFSTAMICPGDVECPAAATKGHTYARSNTDIKETSYKEQILSSYLYNSEHLGTSVPDVPYATLVPDVPHHGHTILRRNIGKYSLAYGGCAFALSHIVIAISFGRIL